MSAIESQINGVSIVYSTFCLDADQRKPKGPRQWFLWGEFTGDRRIRRIKGQ